MTRATLPATSTRGPVRALGAVTVSLLSIPLGLSLAGGSASAALASSIPPPPTKPLPSELDIAPKYQEGYRCLSGDLPGSDGVRPAPQRPLRPPRLRDQPHVRRRARRRPRPRLDEQRLHRRRPRARQRDHPLARRRPTPRVAPARWPVGSASTTSSGTARCGAPTTRAAAGRRTRASPRTPTTSTSRSRGTAPTSAPPGGPARPSCEVQLTGPISGPELRRWSPPRRLTASGYPLLKRGDTHKDLMIAQGALGLTKDGQFGPGTEAAVASFQSRNGVAVTKQLDNATWTKLVQLKLVPSRTGSSTTTQPALRLRQHGHPARLQGRRRHRPAEGPRPHRRRHLRPGHRDQGQGVPVVQAASRRPASSPRPRGRRSSA